jgi:hypothetical protein
LFSEKEGTPMNHKLAVMCLLVLGVIPASAQPRIEVVGGTRLDFGTIYRGEVVNKEVTLKNTGDAVLEILGVNASCGCTGTLVSKDRVDPGGTGTVRLNFNSKNFSGKVTKSITVRSNAAGTGELTIEFVAMIVDEVAIAPQHCWFKDAEVGRATEQTITLTNNSTEPLRLTGFRTQLAGLILKLPADPVPPGKKAEIVAEFTPKNPLAIISDGVFVATSNARQPEVYIPVFGNAKVYRFE